MSRLVKSVCKLTKLSMSNARNAQSLIYRNQLRTLSNTTTTPKPADNVAKAESKEYQWERSDRYVNNNKKTFYLIYFFCVIEIFLDSKWKWKFLEEALFLRAEELIIFFKFNPLFHDPRIQIAAKY